MVHNSADIHHNLGRFHWYTTSGVYSHRTDRATYRHVYSIFLVYTYLRDLQARRNCKLHRCKHSSRLSG